MEAKRVLLYWERGFIKEKTEEKLLRCADDFCLQEPDFLSEAKPFLLTRTELGKPQFLQPQGMFCSPSHSGDLFVAAFSSCSVGADVQRIREGDAEEERVLRIAGRFFHPEERSFLQKETLFRFYLLWTARESYGKLLGTGLDSALSRRSLLPNSSFAPSFSQGEEISWEACGVFFRSRFDISHAFCLLQCELQKNG